MHDFVDVAASKSAGRLFAAIAVTTVVIVLAAGLGARGSSATSCGECIAERGDDCAASEICESARFEVWGQLAHLGDLDDEAISTTGFMIESDLLVPDDDGAFAGVYFGACADAGATVCGFKPSAGEIIDGCGDTWKLEPRDWELVPEGDAGACARPEPTPVVARKYDRRDWPHWRDDEDEDKLDARGEALAAESRMPVTISEDGRTVIGGLWVDQFTGFSSRDPGDFDTDHTVPLKKAHEWGGWRWSRQKRRAYANDLGNPNTLVVMKASANRSKGARGPCEWLPPEDQCDYLRKMASVVGDPRWQFDVPKRELKCIIDGQSTFCVD